MTKSEKNIYHDLQKKYSSSLIKKQNSRNQKYIRLLVALETIERFNRIWIWRLGEYFLLVITLTLSSILGTSIIDYSVGKFQLKISIVFDVFGLSYYKNGKNIFLEHKLSIGHICRIFNHINNYEFFNRSLLLYFPHYSFESLTDVELKQIALFYSRNIEFTGTLNYYNVLKFLYRT